MSTFAFYACNRYYDYIDNVDDYAANVQMTKPNAG